MLRVLLVWFIALSPEEGVRPGDPHHTPPPVIADGLMISSYVKHRAGEKSPHADEAGSHHFVKFKQSLTAAAEAAAIARLIDYYDQVSILSGTTPRVAHRPPIRVV